MTEAAHSRRRQGAIREFDSVSGLGLISTADGVEYAFHCIEIADGSREIEVGAEVTFATLAKFGRYEAADITP
jgi:CspA family cold shock protein